MKKFDDFINNEKIENRFDKVKSKIDFETAANIQPQKKQFFTAKRISILAGACAALAIAVILPIGLANIRYNSSAIAGDQPVPNSPSESDPHSPSDNIPEPSSQEPSAEPREDAEVANRITTIDGMQYSYERVHEYALGEKIQISSSSSYTTDYNVYHLIDSKSMETLILVIGDAQYIATVEYTNEDTLKNADFNKIFEFCGIFNVSSIKQYVKNTNENFKLDKTIDDAATIDSFVSLLKNANTSNQDAQSVKDSADKIFILSNQNSIDTLTIKYDSSTGLCSSCNSVFNIGQISL